MNAAETKENLNSMRLKRLAQITMGQSPLSENCNLEGHGIPFLQGCGEFGERSPLAKQYCDRLPKVAQEGDILLSVRAPVGIMNFADRSYGIGRGLCAITGISIDPAFLHYALDSRLPELRSVATGSTYDAVSIDQVANLELPFPSLLEQTAIAAFLDRETGKIDALVEEQKRLIELLREKRQAVISHAVTKGLDPDAPMKDSGVEWLGRVPVHWEVTQLKRLTPEITVGIVVEPSKYYADEGVPALRSLNVRPGRIDKDGLVYISEDANKLLAKSQLRAGDLVTVRSGQPGTTAVVPKDFDGANCIDLIIIRKPDRGSEWFLSWYLASDVSIRQFVEGAGGAIQQHFNIGTAMNLVIAVPSQSEQSQIADFLETETGKLDELTQDAQRTIGLLKERRAALISAAVTGKIDVREIASIEEAAA